MAIVYEIFCEQGEQKGVEAVIRREKGEVGSALVALGS